jgi:hypothetical protein
VRGPRGQVIAASSKSAANGQGSRHLRRGFVFAISLPSVGRDLELRDFVFFEYRLTRRAKQWHYSMLAPGITQPNGDLLNGRSN